MIEIILIEILIIVLLAFYIFKKEHFTNNKKNNCLPGSYKLNVDKSFKSLSKGRCTNTYFDNTGRYNNGVQLSGEDEEPKCVRGVRMSTENSYKSASKSKCKDPTE